MFHSGGLVFCVAPDMKFIDDKVAEFPVRLRHIAPVKGVLHHAGVVGVFPVGAPDTLSGDRFGVGIEKNFGLVEKQAFFGVIGAVYAVGVFKILDVQTVDDHGVNVPDLVGFREGDHRERLLLGVVEEQQFAGSAARGVDGEVYAVLKGGGPVEVEHAGTYRKTGYLRHGIDGKRIFGYKFLMIRFHISQSPFLYMSKNIIFSLYFSIVSRFRMTGQDFGIFYPVFSRLPVVKGSMDIENALILKYYSFENYFLDPKVMAKIGVVQSEEEFYETLFEKWQDYLHRLRSGRHLTEVIGHSLSSVEDVKAHMEEIRIYVRGHNLYDIFYGRFHRDEEEILRAYIQAAPRNTFRDILDAIDRFVYFQNRLKNAEKQKKRC